MKKVKVIYNLQFLDAIYSKRLRPSIFKEKLNLY